MAEQQSIMGSTRTLRGTNKGSYCSSTGGKLPFFIKVYDYHTATAPSAAPQLPSSTFDTHPNNVLGNNMQSIGQAKKAAATETTALAELSESAAEGSPCQIPPLLSAAAIPVLSPDTENRWLALSHCPLTLFNVSLEDLRATVCTWMGQDLGPSVPFNKSSFLRTCFSTASEFPTGDSDHLKIYCISINQSPCVNKSRAPHQLRIFVTQVLTQITVHLSSSKGSKARTALSMS